MKLIVTSDCHGSLDHLLRIWSGHPADRYVFCGDGWQDAENAADLLGLPLLSVMGNCDRGCRGETELVLELAGVRAMITHGHGYGVKESLGPLLRRAQALEAGLVLFGHTHRPLLCREEGVLLCNHGSCRGELNFAELELEDGRVLAACLRREPLNLEPAGESDCAFLPDGV